MKSTTAKNRYLQKVKSEAKDLERYKRQMRERNLTIHDLYENHNYDHVLKRLYQINANISWYGFKYRLENMCPRSKN